MDSLLKPRKAFLKSCNMFCSNTSWRVFPVALALVHQAGCTLCKTGERTDVETVTLNGAAGMTWVCVIRTFHFFFWLWSLCHFSFSVSFTQNSHKCICGFFLFSCFEWRLGSCHFWFWENTAYIQNGVSWFSAHFGCVCTKTQLRVRITLNTDSSYFSSQTIPPITNKSCPIFQASSIKQWAKRGICGVS